MEKSKLEKYREERARHLEKIADLQKRVRALDQRIMENESMEIRALMCSENVTLEELTALVRRMQQQHRQPVENTAPARRPYKRERRSLARYDGIDRTSARNANLTAAKIGNAQRHNEREKESYTNPDIIPERTPQNIHFKKPTAGYAEMFVQMEQGGIISTRGLKSDANLYEKLIFDVNSAYFYNHGGHEFAKRFYADAYRAAVEIVGGEQYILSAVMHADERNRAMSEALGKDVFHYHLHVVYVPVVEKQILWSKRCKDKSLVGTVKETIMQVSSSKKWLSKPALNEQGAPILQKNGKPVLRKSYSVLQDDFFQAMRNAGYSDVERG